MNRNIGIAILGGTGFGTGELLRLLANHPQAKVCTVTSSSAAETSIGEIHPHLAGLYDAGLYNDLRFAPRLDLATLEGFEHKFVISALPHETSAAAIAEIPLAEGYKVIDLSGDLRLLDPAAHSTAYPNTPFQAALRKQFVYGLPELHAEEIATAKAVANPGCLATAALLALLPAASLTAGKVVIDAKTGSSGSGKDPKGSTHHPVRHANLFAYKALSHQHEPEIAQELAVAGMESPHLSFVPQSTPLSRGIYVTAHLTLKQPTSTEALREIYARFYQNAPFVRVQKNLPEIENIVGSNFCDIGVVCRGEDAVVCAAIDNLVKGMAGQALQNMNLMCGLPQTTGLWFGGLRPV